MSYKDYKLTIEKTPLRGRVHTAYADLSVWVVVEEPQRYETPSLMVNVDLLYPASAQVTRLNSLYSRLIHRAIGHSINWGTGDWTIRVTLLHGEAWLLAATINALLATLYAEGITTIKPSLTAYKGMLIVGDREKLYAMVYNPESTKINGLTVRKLIEVLHEAHS